MAWMNLSPLTPVALTTPRFLRWCSGSRWTTGSTTPSVAWWVVFWYVRGIGLFMSSEMQQHNPHLCLCRDGSAQARCLSWMSTVPGMVFEVVTDICVTCVIFWKEQKAGLLLTPLCFTTALLFVPPMFMGTGVPWSLLLICLLFVTLRNRRSQLSQTYWLDTINYLNKQVLPLLAFSGILSPIFIILSFLCSVVLEFYISYVTCFVLNQLHIYTFLVFYHFSLFSFLCSFVAIVSHCPYYSSSHA